MIGKKPSQPSLFDVGHVFDIRLEPKSFYAQLAEAGSDLFPDSDFEALYSARGRPSTPPSQLIRLLILQTYTGVSDEEAIQRSIYDARWAVVLGKPIGVKLCAKSTLQLFRAHLVIHKQVAAVLAGSVHEAKKKGLLKRGPLRLALDTMPMEGAGAVKDTWNLVASGIWQVIQAAAKELKQRPATWAEANELQRYVLGKHSSLKGKLDIDWSDKAAREGALTEIVQDALRAYNAANELANKLGGEAGDRVRRAQALLGDLLLQDVEVNPEGNGARIKEGTEKDRIPSVTDENQRHGRKSKSKTFTGHKSRTAVDTESGVVLDVGILAGNSGDAEGLADQVKYIEESYGERVEAAIGDCAMGGGETRKQFEEIGVPLYAKVPAENNNKGKFPKSRFEIDVIAGTVTCPAGHQAERWRDEKGGGKVFWFGSQCTSCPLQAQCTSSAQGRSIHVHPQEAELQAARQAATTPEGRAALRERTIVEHRQARLAQLGAKKARYFGHAKCHYQLLMAGTVANLRRVWNWEQEQAQEKAQTPETGLILTSRGPIQRLQKAWSWIWAQSAAIRRHAPPQTNRCCTHAKPHQAAHMA